MHHNGMFKSPLLHVHRLLIVSTILVTTILLICLYASITRLKGITTFILCMYNDNIMNVVLSPQHDNKHQLENNGFHVENNLNLLSSVYLCQFITKYLLKQTEPTKGLQIQCTNDYLLIFL